MVEHHFIEHRRDSIIIYWTSNGYEHVHHLRVELWTDIERTSNILAYLSKVTFLLCVNFSNFTLVIGLERLFWASNIRTSNIVRPITNKNRVQIKWLLFQNLINTVLYSSFCFQTWKMEHKTLYFQKLKNFCFLVCPICCIMKNNQFDNFNEAMKFKNFRIYIIIFHCDNLGFIK